MKIIVKQYKQRGITTYVGRIRYHEEGKYLWSESTGIPRLDPNTAREDAEKLKVERGAKGVEESIKINEDSIRFIEGICLESKNHEHGKNLLQGHF